MLAYAILAIPTWNIYDLTMCQIIFGNYFVDGPVGYMVIMLGTISIFEIYGYGAKAQIPVYL